MNNSQRFLSFAVAALYPLLGITATTYAAQTTFTAPTAGFCARVGHTYTATWTPPTTGEAIYYSSTNDPSTSTLSPNSPSWTTLSGTNEYLWLSAGTPTLTSPTVAVTVDSGPPTAPILAVSSTDQTDASLTWSQPKPSDCVNTYTLYRNGSVIKTFSGSTNGYLDSNLTADTSYVYQVAASDGVDTVNSLAVTANTTAAPTPSPSPSPTITPTPTITPLPSPTLDLGSPTPTVSYDTGNGTALITSPTPTPVIVGTVATPLPLTAAQIILRNLVIAGVLLLLIGGGLLILWKRRTMPIQAKLVPEKKSMTAEVEPDMTDHTKKEEPVDETTESEK